MEKAHSDLMEEISREQALMKKPKDVDTRNETVRGPMKKLLPEIPGRKSGIH